MIYCHEAQTWARIAQYRVFSSFRVDLQRLVILWAVVLVCTAVSVGIFHKPDSSRAAARIPLVIPDTSPDGATSRSPGGGTPASRYAEARVPRQQQPADRPNLLHEWFWGVLTICSTALWAALYVPSRDSETWTDKLGGIAGGAIGLLVAPLVPTALVFLVYRVLHRRQTRRHFMANYC